MSLQYMLDSYDHIRHRIAPRPKPPVVPVSEARRLSVRYGVPLADVRDALRAGRTLAEIEAGLGGGR